MTRTKKRGIKACVASVVALMLTLSMLPNNFILKENKVEAYGEDETGKYYYAAATLYDYNYDPSSYFYNDYLANGNNDTSTEHYYREGQRWHPKLQVPYESINREISSYYSGYTNTSAVPLYFGNFYGTKRGYTGDNPNAGDHHQHTYKDGVGMSTYDQTYNNYWLSANNSPTNGNTAISGLVDKTLTNGQITQDNGNKVLWQFNDGISSNYKQTYPTSTGFPFNINEGANGIKTYTFDSSTDYARVYKNGEIVVKEDGTGRVQNYSTDNVTGGNYGFFPFNDPATTITGNGNRTNVNYGFGMKLEVPFTLSPTGTLQDKDGNDVDIVFDFSGDDDIWVFVDDFLVLDMGGDHAKVDGHINFATGAVTVSNATSINTSGRDLVSTGGSPVNTTLTAQYIAAHGGSSLPSDFYSPSKSHTLTVYYMERGMFESNLKMSFNFYNENQNELTIEEQSLFNRVNTALVAQTKRVADKHVFNYTIQNKGTTNQASDSGIVFPTYEDINRVNTEATGSPVTKLASSNVEEYTSGGTITTNYVYLQPGVWNSGGAKFEACFIDSSGNEIWRDPVSNDGTYWKFEVPDGCTRVTFVRMNPNGTPHSWSGKWNQTNTISINSNTPITQITGWNGGGNDYSTQTSNSSCPGTVTTTTDPEPITFGTIFSGSKDSFTPVSNVAYNLTDGFASDSLTGITGTGNTAGQFNLFYGESAFFRSQFVADSTMRVDQNANLYKVTSNGELGTTKTSDTVPGEYHSHTFGETSRSVSDLYDTKVRAVDLNASNARLSEYTTDQNAGVDYIYKNTDSSSSEPVRIKQTFENEAKVGHLVISKTLEYQEETQKQFTFDLTLSNLFGDDSGEAVDITNLTYDVFFVGSGGDMDPGDYYNTNHGTYERTGNVKDGIIISESEIAVIKGIPVYTDYAVTERADNDYQVKTSTHASGTIQEDTYTYYSDGTIESNTSSVNRSNVTNERKTGQIEVLKNTTGSGADTEKEFDITVDFTFPTGTEYDDVDLRDYFKASDMPSGMTLSSVNKKSATVTFKVKNGTNAMILNIPYGTSFTIAETPDSDYSTGIAIQSIDEDGTVVDQNVTGGSASGTISYAEFAEYYFNYTNEYNRPASIIIKKVNGNNDPVPGAEFQIYENASDASEQNDNTVQGATYTKNAEGTEFTFGNLQPNTTYYVAETVVPVDHQGLTEPLTVTTGNGGTTVSYDVVNIPEDIEMPETGAAQTPFNYMGTGIFVMSLAGVAMLIYKRRLRGSVSVADTRDK